MKRSLLFLALITVPFLTFGQNIKIKKGDILLNKTEKIGTEEKRYDTAIKGLVYTLKDLNGNAITVSRVMRDEAKSNDYYYLLSTNFNNADWELSAKDVGPSTSKGTVQYLINNGLWSATEGMAVEAINAKIAAMGTQISSTKKELNDNIARVKAINPFVFRDGKIVSGGHEGTTVIGYVESPDTYLETLVVPILIYDVNKNLIAKGKSDGIKGELFTTFDGIKHEYHISKELNELTKPLFLSELVYTLMLEGYIYDGKKPFDANVNVFK